MANIRIYRSIFPAALVALLMLLMPSTAAARGGFGVGVGVGPGFWGGYPYYGWGPYGYPYGAYGYPGGYYGGYGGRPMGQVKIKTPERDAEIYVNGSFAGRAHDLKHFYLAPGKYRIEQRIGTDVQKQRVYVTAYRSLTLEFGKVGTPSPQPMPEPPARPGPPPGAGPGYGPGPGNGPGPGPNAAPPPEGQGAN